MKKLLLYFCIITLLIPKQPKAQNDGAAAAAVVTGILAIGAGIAAVKQMEEQAELKATEWLLSNNPELTSFYVKTLDFEGKKLKDMSGVSVITFKIRKFEIGEGGAKDGFTSNDDFDYGDKWVLFGFTSRGWINENGINFNKVRWYLIDPIEWMNMMIEYVKVASGEDDVAFIEETLVKGNIVNKGVKIKSKLKIPFFHLRGDMYVVTDYSDNMKLLYNERSLGIYLKETGDLVQIKRSTLIEVHDYLFYKGK